MIYANFAPVYDRLMQDVPYGEWVKYLHRLFTGRTVLKSPALEEERLYFLART